MGDSGIVLVFAAAVLLIAPVPGWRWPAVAACGLLSIVKTGSVHPHYPAFFNALTGGPAGGREYLVDSNLDWGQDVKNPKEYLDAHRIPQVCISCFGSVNLLADELDCVAVISVSNLAISHDRFAGLDQIQPDARIGYSICVCDLRKRP